MRRLYEKLKPFALTSFMQACIIVLCLMQTGAYAQVKVNLNVNTKAERKPISPLIYGTNDKYLFAPAKRLGGNRITNYNWENNASNAGRDWYHESDNYVPWQQGVPDNLFDTTGAAIKAFHQNSLNQHAYSLITLPMAKYVTRDKNGAVPESQSAPSQRWLSVLNRKPESEGELSLNPNQNDGKVYTDEEINFLIHHFGKSNTPTGVRAYALDNEPGLWFDSHSRMWGHTPVSVKYLMQNSIDLALRVKELDPTAEVYGPASWGVTEFENLQFAPDWDSVKQNYPTFLDLYLDSMRIKHEQHQKRLLDVLDLHWYPMGNNDGANPFGTGTDYHTNAVRMAMTRSLWDSTYIENTWVGNDPFKVEHFLPFIPKMNNKINQRYPGTKLAITEYSYGGPGHASGGIAQADALGIFGKQGLYMATYWGGVVDYIKVGFDIYRNYDGKGATFGNTAVKTETNDVVNASLHASIEGDDDAKLHVIAMNKNQDQPMTATITINSDKVYKSARVWAFDNSSPNMRQLKNVKVINGNTFEYTIPPVTACHLVLTEEDLSIYPDIEKDSMSQAAGYSDGTATFTLTAKVTDGNNDLQNVTVDFSNLNGGNAVPMMKDVNDPALYSIQYTIPAGTSSGLKTFKITAVDATGLSAESTLSYRVIKQTTTAIIWDGDSITKGVGSAYYDGADVIATANAKIERQLTGGNTGAGSLFMHFQHDFNKYTVFTWRISNNDNPADARDLSDYGALEFYIRSNAPSTSDIEISLRDASAQLNSSSGVWLKQAGYLSSFNPNAYSRVRIPLSALTIGSEISLDQVWQINFHSNNAANAGFDVWLDDIKVVPFSHPYKQPVLATAVTTPAKGYADGKTQVKVSVDATDPDNDLASVTIDLSSVNGSNKQTMQLENGKYTTSFVVPSSIADGNKILKITATDSAENAVDLSANYNLFEKASDLVIWNGDAVNTGKKVLVNQQSSLTIDSTGGNFAPVNMNVHLMNGEGFGSVQWDWNDGTNDARILDFSEKRYLSFYIKAEDVASNTDVQIYLKDRFSAGSAPIKLKGAGYVSAFTGGWQLVRIPMSKFWNTGDVSDPKQMTIFGVLGEHMPENGVHVRFDDIKVSGSIVADVEIKTDAAVCGSAGTIAVESVDGNSPSGYTYYIDEQLNPAGANNPVFSGLTAGTYEIRIEGANGFVYIEKVQLANNANGINVSGVVTGKAIDITVSGGSGSYLYAWSNGVTTQDVQELSAGSYTVEVTDEINGCKGAYTAVIAGDPQAAFTVTDASCAPNGKINVTVTDAEGAVQYYINESPNPAGLNNAEFSGLLPGTYSLKIQTVTGFIITKTVTVGGTGTAPKITGVVNNGNVDITVTGGSGIYIYQWSEGSTTQDLMKVPDGNYTVIVTDAATHCTASYSATVINPRIELSITNATCAPNGKIMVTKVYGSGGNTKYYINGKANPAGLTNPEFAHLLPGSYTIKVTGDGGFSITEKVRVEGWGSAPIVTATAAYGDINLTVIGGSGIYGYLWSEGSTTKNLWEVEPGIYTVEVIDYASGCTTNFSVELKEGKQYSEMLNVYPNPIISNGQVIAKYTLINKNGRKISFRDRAGNVLFTKKLSDKTGEVKIPIQNLQPGIYTIVIEGGKSLTKQVIVM
jgi:hypothetical protein